MKEIIILGIVCCILLLIIFNMYDKRIKIETEKNKQMEALSDFTKITLHTLKDRSITIPVKEKIIKDWLSDYSDVTQKHKKDYDDNGITDNLRNGYNHIRKSYRKMKKPTKKKK